MKKLKNATNVSKKMSTIQIVNEIPESDEDDRQGGRFVLVLDGREPGEPHLIVSSLSDLPLFMRKNLRKNKRDEGKEVYKWFVEGEGDHELDGLILTSNEERAERQEEEFWEWANELDFKKDEYSPMKHRDIMATIYLSSN